MGKKHFLVFEGPLFDRLHDWFKAYLESRPGFVPEIVEKDFSDLGVAFLNAKEHGASALARVASFEYADEPEIVSASKVVIARGCRPVRVVLRKLDKQYVVHDEYLVLDGNVWKHYAYEHGDYFDFSGLREGAATALADATKCWRQRVDKL